MPCARRSERHVIPADAAAVRGLLQRLEEGLDGLPQDERDCTLLVLAEALNNVVEHGYAGGPGWIGVTRGRGRAWRIVEAARPFAAGGAGMPGGVAEGGFGWPLIRALTEEVRVRRTRGMNVLTLRMREEGAG